MMDITPDTTCAKCGFVSKAGASYGYACGYGNDCGLYASMASDILPVLKTLPAPAPTLRDAPMSDAVVEAVARAFCRRMGLDPDQKELLGYEITDNGSRAVRGERSLWEAWRAEAHKAIAMHLALKEVLG